MNTQYRDMQKPRKIMTFEPEPDVENMLIQAQECGLTIKQIVNLSLRDCGQKVISGLAKAEAQRFKKLAASSFRIGESQHLAIAA